MVFLPDLPRAPKRFPAWPAPWMPHQAFSADGIRTAPYDGLHAMTQGYREEVLNVVLAQLLNERGVVSTPELSITDVAEGRRLPDVLVVFQGLRTVIEGKVAAPSAEAVSMGQACNRVEEGIAHIGVAVVYPSDLRDVPFDRLPGKIAAARLRIGICTEAGDQGWTEGDLDYLGDLLRRTFDELVKEDVVAAAVGAIEAGVARFARSLTGAPAVVGRAADVLGIGEPEDTPG